MRPRRAVVLGGSGFLGRHVCDAFVAAGAEVIAVSRRLDRLPGTRCVRLDVAETPPGTLRDLLAAAAPTVVVNAAGGVWGVSEEQQIASNVTLVRNVVAAVAGLPRPARLIHLGSVHEYGPVAVGQPIDESTAPNPVDPYGRTKLIGSRHVLAACAAGRVDAAVLRVVNVTGPGAPAGSLLGRVAGQLRAAAGTGVRPGSTGRFRRLGEVAFRPVGRQPSWCTLGLGRALWMPCACLSRPKWRQ